MKYGFVIDNRKCIGCHACTTACKSEHDVPVGVNRTWVKQVEKGEFPNTRRLFSVMRCNHCTDAPCVEICPTEALYFRDDGIVDFDKDRCIGCKSCMQACPYDALYIDPETHTLRPNAITVLIELILVWNLRVSMFVLSMRSFREIWMIPIQRSLNCFHVNRYLPERWKKEPYLIYST